MYITYLHICRWHINEHCDGSMLQLAKNVIGKGGVEYIVNAYPRPSMAGLGYIAGFGVLQALLQITVPGKRFHGPTTPRGNVPQYTANGVQCYLLTTALFFGTWYVGVFDPSRVYDSMGTIISTSNLFSLVLCGFLYAKGRWAPSSSDAGSTGSLIFDYYWGTELFPRLFGQRFDIKVWTNCRMGMAGWGIITLCYAVKQSELLGVPSNAMLVSVGLMHLYIFKFFLWETGYFASMDIAHDRAGFYLCWGCLVWVPAVYTSPSQWLVRRPGTLSPAGAFLTFLAGAIAIYINYDSDRQRQYFRRTRGKAPIWGRPPRKIAALYTTVDGITKESLLLASGWWGLARHFHYVPEVLAALLWSCPGGCSSLVQLIYVAFLTSLLADRAYRDDERCRAKYGKYWELYCEYVPYRVIPLIF